MASSSSTLDPKPQNPTTNPPTPNPLNPTPKTSTPSPLIHKIHEPTYPNRSFMPKHYRPSEQLANSAGLFSSRGSQFPNRSFGASPQSMRPPPSQFGSGRFTGPLKTSPSPVALNHHHSNNNKFLLLPSFVSLSPYSFHLRNHFFISFCLSISQKKVRLSDGASLYALCRSWVRNGLPKETQPPLGEGLKLLPRPLPISVANGRLPEKSGSDDEDEEKEEEVSSVENMSARSLLHLHVKRAKKTRARLRKERLQRIDRYKQRLALLLPPPEEQVRETDVGETF
ncbi:hypothetical protein ACHQM5_018697 [Ranunculus cassubicifolius]